MIIESLDEYLEALSGYIYDSDKLVTYKWLSRELEVHVNVAKQILWEFSQRHQEEKNQERTFLVMGTLHDGGMRVEVVKEENLSKAKEKFSKIISEHIYSLQKTLPDIELLAISGDGDVKYSAIKCKECVERSDEEMHMLRWGSAHKDIQAAPQEKAKPVTESVKESTRVKKEKSPEKKNSDSKKGAQKKGFNNLFGKGNVNNKQKSPVSAASNAEKIESRTSEAQKTPPKENTSMSPKKKAQKGGLYTFLEQGKNQKSTASVSPSSISSISEETKPTNPVPKEKTKEKAISESIGKKEKNTRGKKRNRSKEVSTAPKRKRIMIKSDSSDAGSSDEEPEQELPPSPPPAPPVKSRSPSPPKVKHEGGKRKVLKLVDKTFEEDGYLVTKKVHVYESCSEEEPEVVEPKKLVSPESQPEPKGKKNTKQTTLTNFFRKP